MAAAVVSKYIQLVRCAWRAGLFQLHTMYNVKERPLLRHPVFIRMCTCCVCVCVTFLRKPFTRLTFSVASNVKSKRSDIFKIPFPFASRTWWWSVDLGVDEEPGSASFCRIAVTCSSAHDKQWLCSVAFCLGFFSFGSHEKILCQQF